MIVVATVTDFSVDDVVVVTVCGTGAASVEVVTGGGILTVFSAVVTGEAEAEEGSLEEVSAAGFSFILSVGGDEVPATTFASAVVVTLADITVGEGVQVGLGAGDVDGDLTATVVTFACVAPCTGLVGTLVVVTLVLV